MHRAQQGGIAMKPFTLIAAVLFGIIAVLHAYRVAAGIPIMVHEHEIGQGVSWVAVIVTAVLSVGLFREARR
jgi:hypothetical protein